MPDDAPNGIASGAALVIGVLALSKPAPDGLSFIDALPISWDTRAANDLMRSGRQLLRDSDDLEEFNSITVLLSNGVEKLLRLALGLAHLKEGRGWPTHLRGYGHRLTEMNASLLKKAANSAEITPELLQRIGLVRTDSVWAGLLQVISDFASEGRFYYQDQLAKRTQERETDPMSGWVDVLGIATDAAGLERDMHPDLPRLRDEIEAALMRWWTLLADLAKAGALGERAIDWGERITPAL